MKRKINIYLMLLVAAFLMITLLTGCGSDKSQPPSGNNVNNSGQSAGEIAKKSPSVTELSMFNGPPQGTWRPIAVALQQNIQQATGGSISINIEPGGGAYNVLAANDKKVLAMVGSSAAYDGYVGNPPFEKKLDNVREIAVVNPMIMNLIAIKGSSINKIEDFKGKRVNVTQKGYASELINQMILKQAGLDYNSVSAQFLGENDAIDSLKDGHIDVNMAMGSMPYPPLLDLLSAREVQLVDIPTYIINKLNNENKGVLPAKIPAGTYPGVNYEVNTLNAPVTLTANKDLEEDIVYKITKAIVETFSERQKNFDFLKNIKEEDLAADVGIPFHPGALKYYRERGWIQ